MKASVWAIVVFGLVLVAVGAFAPAALVDARVAHLSEGRLRVADTAGTWWRGKGVLADAAGTWRVPLQWRVMPEALLGGRLVVDLQPGDNNAMPQGRIEAATDAVTVRDFHARFPAQALAVLLPEAARTALGGTIAVQAPTWSWRVTGHEGTANVLWTQARVVSPAGSVELGRVDLPLAVRDGGVTGPITASGGELDVQGSVTVRANGVAVDATLTPAPGAPAGIVRALALLGVPGANGAVRVAWRSGPR